MIKPNFSYKEGNYFLQMVIFIIFLINNLSFG
jgi:hypothetical protein